jgi:predicted DCC family thiol-disulfide oxidoreductase YuxK
MRPKLTVWYNTKCPVCNAGIDRQKNRLVRAARASAIEFRDINVEPDALACFGASVDDVRRRLHALDADGKLFIGVDVAVEIWRRIPGRAWLAGMFVLPGIRQLCRFAYDYFADVLFAWNKRRGHW